MHEDNIYYSQCWEDPQILLKALSIKSDDKVLSITSGGDNSLAILCNGAAEVVAIDVNSAQNYLLELKCIATQSLSYEEYLEFVGVKDSSQRIELYKKVSPRLSEKAKEWWSKHPDFIEIGVIHCGRFDKYVRFFAQHIIPFIHRKKIIQKFLTHTTLEDQLDFYNKVWNTRLWKFIFELATRRQLLMKARQREMFAQTENIPTSKKYAERLEKNISSIPIHGNYFLHYSLSGNYSSCLPPYLQENSYRQIEEIFAKNPTRLTYISDNLLSYLQTVPNNTFSKFNLSDVFEALSGDDNDKIWDEILRTAKSGAQIVYWNNLVKRTYPSRISNHIRTDEKLLNELRSSDRVYFYAGVYVHTIIK